MKKHAGSLSLGIYAAIAAGLTDGIFGGMHRDFNKVTFRDHTTHILSGFERRERIAHRKQIRHNRQRLINKRGYA